MNREEKLPMDLRITIFVITIFIALFFYRALTDWILPIVEKSKLMMNPSYQMVGTWFLTMLFTIISVELLKKYVFFKKVNTENN